MITDELRRYIHREMWDLPKWKNELQPIADRIDAEHEGACAEAYGNGVESVALPDMTPYVKLPVDAEGEPIHVGDVVIAQLPFGGESKPLVVDRMELSRGRDGDLWCVALDTDKGCWNQPSILRHYHEPTVEDVLREFADAWAEWKDGAAMMNPVEEYIAKLQLREGKMSITDELRKWGYGFCGDTHDVVTAIADRIDAEYESSYKDGYNEGAADMQEFCNSMKEAAQCREDVTLWGVDYTALPVDKDGMSVHVDDVMTNGKHVFVVNRICRYTDGWLICDLNGVAWTASDIWHYESPTVENVLREFTDDILEWAGKSGTVAEIGCWSDVAAEYIAKLQLREG